MSYSYRSIDSGAAVPPSVNTNFTRVWDDRLRMYRSQVISEHPPERGGPARELSEIKLFDGSGRWVKQDGVWGRDYGNGTIEKFPGADIQIIDSGPHQGGFVVSYKGGELDGRVYVNLPDGSTIINHGDITLYKQQTTAVAAVVNGNTALIDGQQNITDMLVARTGLRVQLEKINEQGEYGYRITDPKHPEAGELFTPGHAILHADETTGVLDVHTIDPVSQKMLNRVLNSDHPLTIEELRASVRVPESVPPDTALTDAVLDRDTHAAASDLAATRRARDTVEEGDQLIGHGELTQGSDNPIDGLGESAVPIAVRRADGTWKVTINGREIPPGVWEHRIDSTSTLMSVARSDGRFSLVTRETLSDGRQQVTNVKLPDGIEIKRTGPDSLMANPGTKRETPWRGDMEIDANGRLQFAYRFEKIQSQVNLEVILPDGSRLAVTDAGSGALSLPGQLLGVGPRTNVETALDSIEKLQLGIGADRLKLGGINSSRGSHSNDVAPCI